MEKNKIFVGILLGVLITVLLCGTLIGCVPKVRTGVANSLVEKSTTYQDLKNADEEKDATITKLQKEVDGYKVTITAYEKRIVELQNSGSQDEKVKQLNAEIETLNIKISSLENEISALNSGKNINFTINYSNFFFGVMKDGAFSFYLYESLDSNGKFTQHLNELHTYDEIMALQNAKFSMIHNDKSFTITGLDTGDINLSETTSYELSSDANIEFNVFDDKGNTFDFANAVNQSYYVSLKDPFEFQCSNDTIYGQKIMTSFKINVILSSSEI